jgi:hypothetical protein
MKVKKIMINYICPLRSEIIFIFQEMNRRGRPTQQPPPSEARRQHDHEWAVERILEQARLFNQQKAFLEGLAHEVDTIDERLNQHDVDIHALNEGLEELSGGNQPQPQQQQEGQPRQGGWGVPAQQEEPEDPIETLKTKTDQAIENIINLRDDFNTFKTELIKHLVFVTSLMELMPGWIIPNVEKRTPPHEEIFQGIAGMMAEEIVMERHIYPDFCIYFLTNNDLIAFIERITTKIAYIQNVLRFISWRTAVNPITHRNYTLTDLMNNNHPPIE